MTLIVGTNGYDYLTGGDQNDRLVGKDGDDYLDGYGGNDKLEGGKGNDYFYNDFGNDVFTGGAGADTFAFYPDLYTGVDTITDFNPLQDTIQVGVFGGSTEDFTYDSDTGGLFYGSNQFASLEPNLNFEPSTDISFV
jgi:hypothetical protein